MIFIDGARRASRENSSSRQMITSLMGFSVLKSIAGIAAAINNVQAFIAVSAAASPVYVL